jgi:uncharacterized phage protein (TIGR01671 family)
MSRKIKFRAYGGTEYSDWQEVMQYDFDIVASDGEIFYGGEAKPEWKLMQFTGLKDKNGKDVYEGDCLGYLTHNGEVELEGEVEWDKDTASFILIARDVRREILNKMTFWNQNSYYNYRDIKSFMVIGNIYENPELLK